MQNVRVRTLRVFGAAAAVTAAAVLGLAGQASAGVSGPAFYADGALYRTVGTPTDLSRTGAPDHAWDILYSFGDAQLKVAEAAPGDTGYNGGRWQIHELAFPAGYAAAVTNGDLDGDGVLASATEVRAAMTAGSAVDTGVVKQFECPAIPLHN
ncbi:hypothetical protein ACFQZ8_02320 [Micromonospora azadirachtae]|uniref:EF-hand domain-containing protein n=1 Tax=Micromonospora azadirachtae TaxID=1970735 RepID=A0ABW2ZVT8_9ACTN